MPKIVLLLPQENELKQYHDIETLQSALHVIIIDPHLNRSRLELKETIAFLLEIKSHFRIAIFKTTLNSFDQLNH